VPITWATVVEFGVLGLLATQAVLGERRAGVGVGAVMRREDPIAAVRPATIAANTTAERIRLMVIASVMAVLLEGVGYLTKLVVAAEAGCGIAVGDF
jgi:hypothetical protein